MRLRCISSQPLRYRVLIYLTALLFVCPSASADWTRSLKEIYETPIPAEIRKGFNIAVEMHNTCSDCMLGVLDGYKFLDVFPRKFLVLSLEQNNFGNYW